MKTKIHSGVLLSLCLAVGAASAEILNPNEIYQVTCPGSEMNLPFYILPVDTNTNTFSLAYIPADVGGQYCKVYPYRKTVLSSEICPLPQYKDIGLSRTSCEVIDDEE